MATRKQVEAEVAKHGGSIDWGVSYVTGSEKHVCIDAPDGYEWISNGCNVSVEDWPHYACMDTTAADFWDEVLSRVEDGTTPAT